MNSVCHGRVSLLLRYSVFQLLFLVVVAVFDVDDLLCCSDSNMAGRLWQFDLMSPLTSWIIEAKEWHIVVLIGPRRGYWWHIGVEACGNVRRVMNHLARKNVLQVPVEVHTANELLLCVGQPSHPVWQSVSIRAVWSRWVYVEQVAWESKVFWIDHRFFHSRRVAFGTNESKGVRVSSSRKKLVALLQLESERSRLLLARVLSFLKCFLGLHRA